LFFVLVFLSLVQILKLALLNETRPEKFIGIVALVELFDGINRQILLVELVNIDKRFNF
jgi:hypothetical protein